MDLRLRLSAEFAHKIPVFWRLSFDGPLSALHVVRVLVRFYIETASMIGVVPERLILPTCVFRAKQEQATPPKSAISSSQLWPKRNERVCRAAWQGPLPLTNCRLPPLVIWHIHNVTCSEEEEGHACSVPARRTYERARARTRQN